MRSYMQEDPCDSSILIPSMGHIASVCREKSESQDPSLPAKVSSLFSQEKGKVTLSDQQKKDTPWLFTIAQ
jgi:hypothetical protein